MLSGLADFSATVTQAAKSINPLHPEEVDSFSYQVSQQTTVAGRDQAGRRIVQQQSARLQAAYHQSLLSDLPLKLGTDKQSQNYSYHQIEDRADSTLHIAYDQGALVQALLQQTASRKTRVSSYELGKLIKDETTPLQTSRSTDFAAQLRLAQIAGGTPDTSGMQNEARRLQLMSRIGALALLNSDPGALKNADYSLS
jgi:hypothetical protein